LVDAVVAPTSVIKVDFIVVGAEDGNDDCFGGNIVCQSPGGIRSTVAWPKPCRSRSLVSPALGVGARRSRYREIAASLLTSA
jgi:hypothetical protein